MSDEDHLKPSGVARMKRVRCREAFNDGPRLFHDGPRLWQPVARRRRVEALKLGLRGENAVQLATTYAQDSVVSEWCKQCPAEQQRLRCCGVTAWLAAGQRVET